ncbi:hypothetical protein OOT33_13090 [Sphingobium sp. DEHP117]|uniref:hypothetical protein n=1 Tax=Sphingobium sp. DEHP117 TaxID=2993436 RepID=UPI0027D4E939|nr:hypothetical protein [Sphingobium sp. DEHP117]MDQ4421358.1 hypothetical protein [Sphingobium sp. DEHP117]
MRTHPSMFLALLLAPAACAGPVETHLRSAGAGVASDTALMWAPLPVEVQAQTADARAALSDALREKGYRIVDDAPLALSMGLAERPAGIGVTKGQGEALSMGLAERPAGIGVTKGQGEALSPAKQRRPLQSCADRMLRVSISITDRTSGDTRYAGSAEEAHCHARLAEALPRLARLAVADMARPAGARLVQSAGRD